MSFTNRTSDECQMAISDCQTYGSMAESLEVIARIITRYSELEIRVLFRTSQMTKLLLVSLVKLYGSALRFLARARQYYGKGTFSEFELLSHILRSPSKHPRT